MCAWTQRVFTLKRVFIFSLLFQQWHIFLFFTEKIINIWNAHSNYDFPVVFRKLHNLIFIILMFTIVTLYPGLLLSYC